MILERVGWGDDGKGDSIGRNCFAYICFPNEKWLKETILQCIKHRDDGYLQFYRYPGKGGDTMSRDHVGSIILALYINRDPELNWILDNIPWKISRKYSQTIDFWLWHRALKYQKMKWFLSQIFYFLILIQFIFIIPWNFLIRSLAGIKKLNISDLQHEEIKGWRKIVANWAYPHYALYLLAWQVKVLNNSWFKKMIQLLLRIESGNRVIDAILGKRLDDNIYFPMTSFIWSRRLDTSDDILLRPLTESERKYNDLNQAMLDYLYFGIDKIMLEYDDQIIRAIKDNSAIIGY